MVWMQITQESAAEEDVRAPASMLGVVVEEEQQRVPDSMLRAGLTRASFRPGWLLDPLLVDPLLADLTG